MGQAHRQYKQKDGENRKTPGSMPRKAEYMKHSGGIGESRLSRR
jgi:hypothetical protein